MQDFIAGLLAVLGTLLVLAGATITVLKTLSPTTEPSAVSEDAGTSSRLRRWFSRLNGANRLIGWGVIILALGVLAAGALSFELGASAGTR